MSPVKAEPGSGRARPKRKAVVKGAPAKKKVAAKKKPVTKKKAPRKTATKKASPVDVAGRSRIGKLNWRRSLVFAAKAVFIFGLVFVTITGLWMVTYLFVNPPMTPLMLIRHFQDEEDIRNRWRSYDEISPEFLLAVVAAEDQLFFKHNGFDLKQIRNAIETRLEGGRLRGGSTISQQVAKNLFLWPGRSWVRKGLEVYFTLGIEFCWPKKRILEMYVNVAELGPGIYGVESAARHYYHKPARDLNREESAMLAAVLPAPRSRSPLEPTTYMQERQGWILGQMHNLGGAAYLVAR